MALVEDSGLVTAGAGVEAGGVQVGHVIAWHVRKGVLPRQLPPLPGVVEVGEPPVEVAGRGPRRSRAGHSGRSLGVLKHQVADELRASLAYRSELTASSGVNTHTGWCTRAIIGGRYCG